MKLFCKHDYEIIKEYEIKSVFDKLKDALGGEFECTNLVIFRSKQVIVYKCKKCNKIKESVISNM